MTRWMTVSIGAAEVAGDAAEHDAQHQAQRHADQADRHRRPRGVHQPRPQVAALRVGAEQEQRLARLGAFDPDQVAIGRDEAEQLVRSPCAKNVTGILRARVGHVDALERQRIARALQRDARTGEAAVVEPVDRLRRDQRALRLGGGRVGVGEEVGEQRDQVEQRPGRSSRRRASLCLRKRHHMSCHCVATAMRSSATTLARRRACAAMAAAQLTLVPSRMRGSTHISSRSERNVPIDRHHAEQQDDGAGQEHVLRDQRLEQQRADRRQAQHERHDDAARHDVRQQVADGADERIERHAHRVLQDDAVLRAGRARAPSPRRACAIRRAGSRA